MNIYLVSTAYEGNADVAFTTQELAELWLINNGGDCVIEITLNGNGGYTITTPSEMLLAHREQVRIDNERMWAEHQEWRNNELCPDCGIVNRDCKCWESTVCGDNGGITRQGTPCLNEVLVRDVPSGRCHHHRTGA